MASTNIIRRAASRVIPSAFRATRTQRYHHHQRGCATLFSAAAPPTRGGALPQKLFSSHNYATKSKSDETLVRVIDSEIQCAEESDDNDKIEDIPESFPFKIEDEPGQQTVTLTREYQGESISVEVSMPDLTGEENENDDDDDSETRNQSQLPMVVRVSKRNGPCLEFGVTALLMKLQSTACQLRIPRLVRIKLLMKDPILGIWMKIFRRSSTSIWISGESTLAQQISCTSI
ncbi:hypothetical protein Leryth_019052 [Lithospermum erythrorhizon]|nr:hypothetical protein Leryth_019052 [Lithospermum erythrorhizon]